MVGAAKAGRDASREGEAGTGPSDVDEGAKAGEGGADAPPVRGTYGSAGLVAFVTGSTASTTAWGSSRRGSRQTVFLVETL